MSQKIGPDPFSFGPWTVESSQGPILGHQGLDHLSEELDMKSLPDMIFDKNFLLLKYKDKFELKFNVKDALQTCDKSNCPDIQVAAAESWIRDTLKAHMGKGPNGDTN